MDPGRGPGRRNIPGNVATSIASSEAAPLWLDDLVHLDDDRGRVLIDSIPEV